MMCRRRVKGRLSELTERSIGRGHVTDGRVAWRVAVLGDRVDGDACKWPLKVTGN